MTQVKDFGRDRSGALISTSKEALTNYKASRAIAAKEKAKIESMETQINSLDDRMKNMELLLNRILDKVSN